MKRTEQQKEQDKKRKQLQFIHNSIRSAWSSGSIKTFGDYYRKLGITNPVEKDNEVLITYDFIREHLKAQVDTLEQSFFLTEPTKQKKQNEPIIQISQKESVSIQTVPEREASQLLVQDSSQQNSLGTEVSISGRKPDRKHSEEELNNTNDYGLVKVKTWKAFHYWFQKKAIKECLDKILGFDTSLANGSFDQLKELYDDPSVVKNPKSGVLLLSGTGTGKTFMVLAVCRILRDLSYEEGKTFSHIPYLYITRTTVVEQASRVALNVYNLTPEVDIEIINIEQIRSKQGRFWIREEVKIVQGEEVSNYAWKQGIQPCVVFFDESQAAKNHAISKQGAIMCAFNNLKGVCLISVSATPFTRVSEAKCFAVSTHRPLEHLMFPVGSILKNENWGSYSSTISEGNPEEYNEAAIERLMKDLDAYTVRVRGVKPQFNADNSIEKIQFESPEEALFYHQAMIRFKERKAKSDAGDTSEHPFVILQQFSMSAEECRASRIAQKMFDDVSSGRYAAVAAVKWKTTIIKIVLALEKLGVKRDEISLVWGGGQTQLNKKQKAKQKILSMGNKLASMGMNQDELLAGFGLDEVEDRQLLELPEHLRLGAQSLESRQEEIDRFQSGRSLYCIYTFRAGGVGLSLHHTDELSTDWDRSRISFKEWYESNKIGSLVESGKLLKGKCRRKESGYAVEEDIPFIPIRPRKNIVAPTYSAIELVQGLGRCPRLTSLSVTIQRLLYYTGTIEDDIADIVSLKLKCLGKVVKMREDWMSVVDNVSEKQKFLDSSSSDNGDSDFDNNILIDEGEE